MRPIFLCHQCLLPQVLHHLNHHRKFTDNSSYALCKPASFPPVCIYSYVCVCLSVKARGQCWVSSSVILSTSFVTRCLTSLKHTDLARLASQEASGVLLLLLLQYWDCKHPSRKPTLYVGPRDPSQVLMLARQTLN